MSKLFTLTCLFGALTFASCSGEEATSDTTSDEVEATVISTEEAAANAAAEIPEGDVDAAHAALDDMLKD